MAAEYRRTPYTVVAISARPPSAPRNEPTRLVPSVDGAGAVDPPEFLSSSPLPLTLAPALGEIVLGLDVVGEFVVGTLGVVGEGVGALLGRLLGCGVGCAVGCDVGCDVGLLDGCAVGCSVGCSVGCDDGCAVGCAVG